MGGLARPMPITAATWIIGSLALAGVPPLAGFFSKDEVIHSVLANNTVAGIALMLASFLTAFYITRATRLDVLRRVPRRGPSRTRADGSCGSRS